MKYYLIAFVYAAIAFEVGWFSGKRRGIDSAKEAFAELIPANHTCYCVPDSLNENPIWGMTP